MNILLTFFICGLTVLATTNCAASETNSQKRGIVLDAMDSKIHQCGPFYFTGDGTYTNNFKGPVAVVMLVVMSLMKVG